MKRLLALIFVSSFCMVNVVSALAESDAAKAAATLPNIIKTDLSETTDLAAKEVAKFDELAAKFAEWEKGMKPAQWTRQDARTETGATAKKGTAKAGNRIAEALKNADKNGDGKLTREEYPKPELFDVIDANKDGFATTEEIKAYYAKQRPK